MKRTVVAGVDCSTQATKVVLVDAADGRIVGDGRAEHVVSGTHGARETDPEVWHDALRHALAATGRGGEVSAIAIAAQQHGLVVLDADGAPLRPAVLWNDTRSAPDAAALVEALGGPVAWADGLGVVPVSALTVSKWAWLRRTEPRIAAATRGVRLPHDYLTERLCGRAVTDRGDASGTGWWSTISEGYADEVLSLPLVDLDRTLLPEVLAHDATAGTVDDRAARELGLRAGTLVAPGTGDNQAAALGLGTAPGTPVMSLGTSGTAFAVMTAPTRDASGVVAGFADASGRFLPLACTLNATLIVDRMAGWLGIQRDEVVEGGSVVVLPYFDGERTPNLPLAAGSVLGLRHATSPGEILMAAYEGVIAGLLLALERLDELGSGLDSAAPLVLIGGGAQGRAWRQVVRRLSGRAVLVPQTGELVAMGAAVQAAAVLNREDTAAVAARWQTLAGPRLEPLRVDTATLERIAEARDALMSFNS